MVSAVIANSYCGQLTPMPYRRIRNWLFVGPQISAVSISNVIWFVTYLIQTYTFLLLILYSKSMKNVA